MLNGWTDRNNIQTWTDRRPQMHKKTDRQTDTNYKQIDTNSQTDRRTRVQTDGHKQIDKQTDTNNKHVKTDGRTDRQIKLFCLYIFQDTC